MKALLDVINNNKKNLPDQMIPLRKGNLTFRGENVKDGVREKGGGTINRRDDSKMGDKRRNDLRRNLVESCTEVMNCRGKRGEIVI